MSESESETETKTETDRQIQTVRQRETPDRQAERICFSSLRDEDTECCRLITFVICSFIAYDGVSEKMSQKKTRIVSG